LLPFLPQVSITLANSLKDLAPRDLLELIEEDSPLSLSPKASLASMEVSAAEAVVEAAGEAVEVETSEVKTIMASEDAELPEEEEEDLVGKVIGTMVLRLNKDLIILTMVSEAEAEAGDQEEDVVDEMTGVEEDEEASEASGIGITRLGEAEDC